MGAGFRHTKSQGWAYKPKSAVGCGKGYHAQTREKVGGVESPEYACKSIVEQGPIDADLGRPREQDVLTVDVHFRLPLPSGPFVDRLKTAAVQNTVHLDVRVRAVRTAADRATNTEGQQTIGVVPLNLLSNFAAHFQPTGLRDGL